MKKSTCLFILFTLAIGFPCYSQALKPGDTLKARNLLIAGRDTLRTNPPKCMQMAEEAVAISRRLNYPFGLAAGLLLEGSLYSTFGKPAEAITTFKEALKVSRENSLPVFETKANMNLGNMFMDIGDYEQSKEYFGKAFKLNEIYPDSQNLSHAYVNYGLLLNHMKDYEGGIRYMEKGGELARALNMPDGVQVAYSNIAESYIIMKNYKQAFNYLFRSLQLSDSSQQLDNLPYTYATLGTCYDKIGRKDSALYYYYKSLAISTRLDDKDMQVTALSYMGEVYHNMGKLDSAEKNCKAALLLAGKISDRFALYNIQFDLAHVYASEQKYKDGFALLDTAFMNRDSLLGKNKEKEMAEMAVRYDTKALENKNRLLQQETDLQKLNLQRKNIFIYGSVCAMVALLVIGLLLNRQSRLKASQQRIELEQKQLRAQMNPHFIFNCLNSIQHFVVANDVKNANRYLSGFASLMRQTLENSKAGTITLRKELTYLENYLALELMRFEDKFSYKIVCAENIEKDRVEIPSMIIQPFIENAIRHGLCYLKEKQGELTVKFYMKETHLFCEIDDNGIGREQSQKLKVVSETVYESQGMELTRQRLALVSKSNGSDYEIEIKDKKNASNEAEGTTITIKFPSNI